MWRLLSSRVWRGACQWQICLKKSGVHCRLSIQPAESCLRQQIVSLSLTATQCKSFKKSKQKLYDLILTMPKKVSKVVTWQILMSFVLLLVRDYLTYFVFGFRERGSRILRYGLSFNIWLPPGFHMPNYIGMTCDTTQVVGNCTAVVNETFTKTN